MRRRREADAAGSQITPDARRSSFDWKPGERVIGLQRRRVKASPPTSIQAKADIRGSTWRNIQPRAEPHEVDNEEI